MPHRQSAAAAAAARPPLASVNEDEEDDELMLGHPSYGRPPVSTSASAPGSSRGRSTYSRGGRTNSVPGPLGRRQQSRYSNFYFQFTSRHQKLDPDDGSLYFYKGDSDSEDEDQHIRRTSAPTEVVSNGVDAVEEEEVRPRTTAEIRRLEWQAMLTSVLNGDVLRSEKTRINRALESFEAQRINRLELWQELRARLRGRTVEQEEKVLEEKRHRIVTPLVDEILGFRIHVDTDPRPTSSDFDSPLKQVASLLRRWDAAESLFANNKALRQMFPETGSDKFIARIDALNSWHTVVVEIRGTINSLKSLVGNDALQLDVPTLNTRLNLPGGRISDRPDSSTFVERILKEDGLRRTFERGVLVELQNHVYAARHLVLTCGVTLEEMNLPYNSEDLLTIIGFPSRLMEQVLRTRLAIAQQVIEPSLMSVDQMLDDFRLAIGLSCTVKNDYDELMAPEGQWNLPSRIGPEYEATLLAALRFFFKLIHLKLRSAHKSIYFKETELLEAQWYIMEEVTLATQGGGLLVAEHVCSVVNKLILRVIGSFQGQIHAPAYHLNEDGTKASTEVNRFGRPQREQSKPSEEVTAEDTIRWFAKVLDGVRLRHRKLHRYSRLLLSRFGNAAEYSLADVNMNQLMNTLVTTEHFLVYTEMYEQDGIYIIGHPSLYHSPDRIQQILSRAFEVKIHGHDNPALQQVTSPQEGMALEDEFMDPYGQYLLILTPQDNFVWRGTVLVLALPQMDFGIKPLTARIVAPNPDTLPVSKDRFESIFLNPDMPYPPDTILQMPLTITSSAMANLPPVNRELKKINRATNKLAEVIVDSVHNVKEILSGVDGAQELMENWFLFASEHGQAALRWVDQPAAERITNLLGKLAISWVAFICDSCDPSDRKTFRWAVSALEFAMARTRGNSVLLYPEAEFKLLQQKVASCMTLLVSHFDILGARSSHEEREREKDKERMKALAEDMKSVAMIDLNINAVDEELIVHAPPDQSIRLFFDRMARNISKIEATRDELLVQQHAAGRVLMIEGTEDESLMLLASNASKNNIRWQQGRFIGSGAFGSVYLALNIDTGEVMAAKEIKFKSSTSLSGLYQQVKDELAVMELLHHPNIVEYYGLEVHRDKVYIFEEYCGGGTLTGLLESGRIEDETVVKVYTMQMVEGVMYLHSQGVHHRDIKPDNILLDTAGVIKFADFGAAKIFTKNKGSIMSFAPSAPSAIPNMPNLMNSLTGTPMYMSPEVIKSDRPSRPGAMDIWSLGCVVLECVTGRKPWSNLDNEWAIMFHIGIATQHPPLPEPGQLSSKGIDFIRQCLTIDGVRRPSASELYEHPWLVEFRDELLAYDQIHGSGSEGPQTPSLGNSSLRTELSDNLGRALSMGSREKLYEAGLISPPGVFGSDTAP